MFLSTCPYGGTGAQSEFSNAGEAHVARPANGEELTDEQWADFVFLRNNPKGLFAERWVHSAGCRRFFNMLRNTATDEILAVYEIGAKPPKVTTVEPSTPSGEAPIGSGNDAVKVMRPEESN